MKSFDLVIPAYNEEQIIERNLKIVYDFLELTYPSLNWVLTLSNNASTDKTGAIGRQMMVNRPRLKVIDVPQKGKGNAVYEAWKQSLSDIVTFFDADLAVNLKSFPLLIESVTDEFPVAIGSRNHPDSQVSRDFVRSTTSWVYNKLAKVYLKSPYSDHQCGFKAIMRNVFLLIEPNLTEREWFFDTELLYQINHRKISVKEVPVIWQEADRQSRVTSIKDNSKKGLKTIIKLKRSH